MVSILYGSCCMGGDPYPFLTSPTWNVGGNNTSRLPSAGAKSILWRNLDVVAPFGSELRFPIGASAVGGMLPERPKYPSRHRLTAGRGQGVAGATPSAPSATSRTPRRRDAPRSPTRAGGGRVLARLPTSLAQASVRTEALQALEDDVHAVSNRHVVDTKLRTVEKALRDFGLSLTPPSVLHVKALGAALKYGGYRSADTYFSQYKLFLERSNYQLDPAELRAIVDGTRSCKRGIGAPVRAMALPFNSTACLICLEVARRGLRAARSALATLSSAAAGS